MDTRTSAARGSRPLVVLTMHSLHLHAGAPGSESSLRAEAPTSVGDAHAVRHHTAAHHAAAHHAAGHHGPGAAGAGADVGKQEHDGGAAGDAGCATCPADHLGLALTCLVALLMALALVVRPRA